MSRKERLKVYHGLPKSVTDQYTVYYASFDGKTIPEIGEKFTSVSGGMTSSPTGLGFVGYKSELSTFVLPSDTGTVDFWIDGELHGTYSDTFDIAGIRCFITSNSNVSVQIRKEGSSGATVGTYLPRFEKYVHVRVCYTHLDVGLRVRIYFNGIQYLDNTINGIRLSVSQIPSNPTLYGIKFGANNVGVNFFVSDLHISNIDRGDYFPNLPQDFIDGKAIVRPRMGQQQIKGDPLYSQETTDIVKISGTNEPQITCSRTTGNWASGDIIKIKGLSKEIISGVIDSDTALFNSLEPDPYQPRISPATIRVDKVDGLNVGDTLYRVNRADNSVNAGPFSIAEIDSVNKIIKLNNPGGATNLSNAYYFIETTTTSSSPIVKTSDGTTVTGTWSNLGTNEATFTLGTNASLVAQDLYITYSLNIAPGNSDFTEMPYSIEKVYDETGNELREVSDIMLYDDFRGKILGSTLECPHIYKYALNKSLSVLSGFSEVQTQDNYNRTLIEDGVTTVTTSTLNNGVSQHLFSFNLIEMVERKFGKIPNTNKLVWLKQNLTRVAFTHKGYGVSVNGPKLYVANYRVTDNTWRNAGSHTSSTVGRFQWVLVDNNAINDGRIDDNGFVHFVAYTDASDGVTEAKVYTDLAFIEVSLKSDSTFTTYFSQNNRSREMPCNPVLIQKETKTVKRYLPSDECFSTEILYSNPNPTNGTLGDNVIYSFPYMYISTQGTGSYNDSNDYFKECLAKLGFSKYSSYEFTNDIITNYQEFIGVNSPIRFQAVQCDSYHAVNRNNIPKGFDFKGNFVALKPTLLNINNEMILNVYARVFRGGISKDVVEQKNYKIYNKPLIK